MAEDNNRTLRIRTNVGNDLQETDNYVTVQLDQEYDSFEILSLKMSDTDAYKLHNSNYGVIAGRVIANGGFGVPNAKISVFIEADSENDPADIIALYAYSSTKDVGVNDYRYNLLTDKQVDDCHKVVGSFPNKTFMLDNDVIMEVFDEYFKFTARSNNSGDFLICGVPTGNHTLHMDLDISDCGILSQRPRDFVYKGYTIEQFENANQFKSGSDYGGLSQVFSQDTSVYVQPFWGNSDEGETIGITRADIDVNFKFEPTCVFMGCVVSDAQSNGISKKCVPTENMGLMEELTTGEGKIEMIRKTPGGSIEEFQIKGNALIDGNGVWCYQIPMNLDYMKTDEYGNMVPTDDPDKGIPTRAQVRFRISLNDFDGGENNFFRGKVLVPNNCYTSGLTYTDKTPDYNFGSKTEDRSFRDLFWNNVYTVKSFIPRFQKSKQWKNKNFSGIKGCNHSGNNNPIPYNNIRIRLPFMFVIMCALIKAYIRIVKFINLFNLVLFRVNARMAQGNAKTGKKGSVLQRIRGVMGNQASGATYTVVADGLCPDLETWYFAPIANSKMAEKWDYCSTNQTPGVKTSRNYFYTRGLVEEDADDDKKNTNKDDILIDTKINDGDIIVSICDQTLANVVDTSTTPTDSSSTDYNNSPTETAYTESYCLTKNTDYLISCIEMNLAQEYKVINFDFYNDWINGMIYIPRWVREHKVKTKRRLERNEQGQLKSVKYTVDKIKGCMDDSSIFGQTRRYVQQCGLKYVKGSADSGNRLTKISSTEGCSGEGNNQQICHKSEGLQVSQVFGHNGGIVHEQETMAGQHVYYCKPWEFDYATKKIKTNFFATDLVLLGSLNDCSLYGIPQAFKELISSSYIMPTNLALTNMDSNGSLYANNDGTFCTGQRDAGSAKTLGVTEADNSYSGTAIYFSTLSGTSEYIGYGKKDDTYSKNNGVPLEDLIPVTEAAGIAWNYTGPGQESFEDKKSKLKRPGGHFLGLSCTNSQVNIKSCVNLQRICEVGANMSQRRQLVRKVNGDGGYSYSYFVPTGLISTEDISNVAFRTMFASMNMRPLIADRTDESTGFKLYSFDYMRPHGFDGGLKSNLKNDWSKPATISDKDITYLKSLGVIESDSFDSSETANTYYKTTENSVNDYYDFRFGLNLLQAKNETFIKRKYLVNNNYLYNSKKSDSYSIPQYENSFYFYFGLKDGATAFDKLLSNFFATCNTTKTAGEPSVSLVIGSESVCTGSTCTIVIDNMTPIYNIHVEYCGKRIEITHGGTSSSEDFQANEDYFTFSVGTEYFGKKLILFVNDSNTLEKKLNFSVGNNIIDIVEEPNDFKVEILSDDNLNSKTGTTRLSDYFCREYYYNKNNLGGYIEINKEATINKNKVEISTETGNTYAGLLIVEQRASANNEIEYITLGKTIDIAQLSDYYKDLLGLNESPDFAQLTGKLINNTKLNNNNLNYDDLYYGIINENDFQLFMWNVKSNYDIYLIYTCDNGGTGVNKYQLLYTEYFKGLEGFDMTLGINGLCYKSLNPERVNLKQIQQIQYRSVLESEPEEFWWKGDENAEYLLEKDDSPISSWVLKKSIIKQYEAEKDDEGNITNGYFDLRLNCYDPDGSKCDNVKLLGTPENLKKPLTSTWVNTTGVTCNVYDTDASEKYSKKITEVTSIYCSDYGNSWFNYSGTANINNKIYYLWYNSTFIYKSDERGSRPQSGYLATLIRNPNIKDKTLVVNITKTKVIATDYVSITDIKVETYSYVLDNNYVYFDSSNGNNGVNAFYKTCISPNGKVLTNKATEMFKDESKTIKYADVYVSDISVEENKYSLFTLKYKNAREYEAPYEKNGGYLVNFTDGKTVNIVGLGNGTFVCPIICSSEEYPVSNVEGVYDMFPCPVIERPFKAEVKGVITSASAKFAFSQRVSSIIDGETMNKLVKTDN